jgi:hypothetical protein
LVQRFVGVVRGYGLQIRTVQSCLTGLNNKETTDFLFAHLPQQ